MLIFTKVDKINLSDFQEFQNENNDSDDENENKKKKNME